MLWSEISDVKVKNARPGTSARSLHGPDGPAEFLQHDFLKSLSDTDGFAAGLKPE